jgi:chromosome segregation ATPase
MGEITDSFSLLLRQIKPLEDTLDTAKQAIAALEQQTAVLQRELQVVARERDELNVRNAHLAEQNADFKANLRTACEALLRNFEIERVGNGGSRFTPKSPEQKQLEGINTELTAELNALNVRDRPALPEFMRAGPREEEPS